MSYKQYFTHNVQERLRSTSVRTSICLTPMLNAIKHKFKEFFAPGCYQSAHARALHKKKGMIFQRLLLRIILSSVILVSQIPAPITLLSGKLGSSPVARFYQVWWTWVNWATRTTCWFQKQKATSSPFVTDNRLNRGNLLKHLHSHKYGFLSRQNCLKISHFAVPVIVKVTHTGY